MILVFLPHLVLVGETVEVDLIVGRFSDAGPGLFYVLDRSHLVPPPCANILDFELESPS